VIGARRRQRARPGGALFSGKLTPARHPRRFEQLLTAIVDAYEKFGRAITDASTLALLSVSRDGAPVDARSFLAFDNVGQALALSKQARPGPRTIRRSDGNARRKRASHKPFDRLRACTRDDFSMRFSILTSRFSARTAARRSALVRKRPAAADRPPAPGTH